VRDEKGDVKAAGEEAGVQQQVAAVAHRVLHAMPKTFFVGRSLRRMFGRL
jgi:hypothetical protein